MFTKAGIFSGGKSVDGVADTIDTYVGTNYGG